MSGKRIFVNGLSIGSLSGAHVLFGHLEQLVHASENLAEIFVLLQPGMELPESCRMNHVQQLKTSGMTKHWSTRLLWEIQSLPNMIRRLNCDTYFTPAGTILPRCDIPQYSLAQNPWPMVRHLHRSWLEKFKASQLRKAYKMAYQQAECMIYNSHHMHELYSLNAPQSQEGKWIVAYQGINEETFHDASSKQGIERKPFSILSVSAMAHWKGAESLIKALKVLRAKDIPATITFVGPWPDPEYRKNIDQLIITEKLQPYIEIKGKVSVEELQQSYATHLVYCLMSECESFGIPAVEAQAYGTPVVGSNVCAMPEIGGEGGCYTNPQDYRQVARYLEKCLTDTKSWNQLSQAAKNNAARFHWDECSKPLVNTLLNLNSNLTNQSSSIVTSA